MTIGRRRHIAETAKSSLQAVGIGATVTESVDGSVSGLETKWTYELDQPGAGYRIGYKAVSVCVGHYMLWYAADLMKRIPVTIFEDDARMVTDWREKLKSACEFLPDDWDMLFLGSCCTAIDNSERLGNGLHRMRSVLCTHAYMVSAHGLPLLLKYCHQVWAPIDVAITVRAIPYIKAYAILPSLAGQNGTVLPP